MQAKICRLYISIKSTGQYMSNITEVHQGITSPACDGADQHHKRCKTLLQIHKLLHAYDHHTTFIFTPFTRRTWVCQFLPRFSSIHLFQKRTFGISGTGFYRLEALLITQPTVTQHVLQVTISVVALTSILLLKSQVSSRMDQ